MRERVCANSRSANLAGAACGLHDNTSHETGFEGSLKVASTPLQLHLHIGGAAPPQTAELPERKPDGPSRECGQHSAAPRHGSSAESFRRARRSQRMRSRDSQIRACAGAPRQSTAPHSRQGSPSSVGNLLTGPRRRLRLARGPCGLLLRLDQNAPQHSAPSECRRPAPGRQSFADSVRDTLSPLITTQKTRRVSGRLPRGTATRTPLLSRSRSFASTTEGSSVPHSAKPGSTEIELCAFATPCTQGRQLSTPRHRSASETKSSDPPLQIHVAQNPCGLRLLPAVGKSCASPPSDGPATSSFRLLHGSFFVVWNDLCPPNHNQTNTYS